MDAPQLVNPQIIYALGGLLLLLLLLTLTFFVCFVRTSRKLRRERSQVRGLHNIDHGELLDLINAAANSHHGVNRLLAFLRRKLSETEAQHLELDEVHVNTELDKAAEADEVKVSLNEPCCPPKRMVEGSEDPLSVMEADIINSDKSRQAEIMGASVLNRPTINFLVNSDDPKAREDLRLMMARKTMLDRKSNDIKLYTVERNRDGKVICKHVIEVKNVRIGQTLTMNNDPRFFKVVARGSGGELRLAPDKSYDDELLISWARKVMEPEGLSLKIEKELRELMSINSGVNIAEWSGQSLSAALLNVYLGYSSKDLKDARFMSDKILRSMETVEVKAQRRELV